ncbi:predicted protein [Naegleria gruberi]|uniref:Predicted protein n=1 Tax=Naegleria gruberi TaxID=5762 RepID=D2VB44_NAEGR|nr:uncharacterized protein NAEGRDRAFT_48110 [Naegleria gruberi]EFC46061.1 predicted protein [Naegleria gruberi]|eukprot:XP_002678805.1 predicted protein [Naegleria gruberi strain NEG-M]
MATQAPPQLNQSFSGIGFGNHHRLPQQQPLKTPERRPLRASFQASSSSQKTTLLNPIISNTPNIQPTPILNNKATPSTPTPNRHAHHSRSKSYCGVAHYGIGSTTEIIITSKSRLQNKLVKEEPVHSSPSMLLDDKENAVNNLPPPPSPSKAVPQHFNSDAMPSLPALAAVKKSWQLNSPQKNGSTPTKKRSTSCLTPSTPLSISTSLTTIREPLTMVLTPKSRARYQGISGTHKFNAYSRINNIDAISISISEDEGLLWSGSDDSLIRVWDTNTGLTIKEITHSPQLSKNKSVESLDDSSFVSSFSSGTSNHDNSKNSITNAGVTQLSYCTKTNRVWSASRDCSVKIWNPTSFICEHTINFPSYVNCMHIAGQYVWVATNKELSIWNVNDKSLVARFPVNGFVWCIKTVGDRVWIACSDKSIRVYNINETGVTQVEKRHFHGSKRLSSEFILMDVTSPLGQQPIMPLFPTNHHDSEQAEEEQQPIQVEEEVDDEHLLIKEINYNDFAPSQTMTLIVSTALEQQQIGAQESRPVIGTFSVDDISIMLQTDVMNIDEAKNDDLTLQKSFDILSSEPSWINSEMVEISPLREPPSLETFQLQSPSNRDSEQKSTTTELSSFTTSPIKSLQPVPQQTMKQFVESTIDSAALVQQRNTSLILPPIDNSTSITNVKIKRAVSEENNQSLLGFKADSPKPQSIELRESSNSPQSSPSSSDNCLSFSNARLLFTGDDVVDFEEPHHKSRGCASIFAKVLGRVFACFSLPNK